MNTKIESVPDTYVLAQRIKELLHLRQEIKTAEELIDRLKQSEIILSGSEIPNLLQDQGISSIKMEDGSLVEVKPFYAVRITEETREAAFRWLRDNGHEAIIKNGVMVEFDKGGDDKARELVAKLRDMGFPATAKESVHPQTLKALAKECIENGQPFDPAPFNLFIGSTTTIKTP